MVDGGDPAAVERARRAQRLLFEGVVAREGSISGEHGIGYTKVPFVSLELSPEVIALSKRLKQAFDPHGILNPGRSFPSERPCTKYEVRGTRYSVRRLWPMA